MSDEQIIKLWLEGLTKYELAVMYRNDFNRRVKENRKRDKETKIINKNQALAHIEPILLNEVRSWKGA